MKLAITSDSHDNWINLEKAVSKANELNCERLLFAGDLISPPGLAILEKFNGTVDMIFGNNEGEKVGLIRKAEASSKITLHGDIFESVIEELKVFMVHTPRIAELAAASNEFDLVIHGHFHDEKRIVNYGRTLLMNPGGLHLRPKDIPSICVFDTKTREAKHVELNL